MSRLLLALLSTLPCACSSTAVSRGAVEALLEDQRQAWNRGDWAGFLAGYWDHPQLTFNGRNGMTRGPGDLLRRFQESYPDAAARGRLTFQVLEFRRIGSHAALVLGRYHLERTPPASGYFSLVVEHTSQGLRITHDHTSESPRDAPGAETGTQKGR